MKRTGNQKLWKGGKSLRAGVGEGDTLLNIALQSLESLGKELLLLLSNVTKDIDSLLGTVGLDTVSFRFR